MTRTMFYRAAWSALLACLWIAPAHAQAGEGSDRPDLYQQALQSISEGRRSDASRELSQLIQQEPLHAGAWFDLAMTQCALGHGDEAERMFATIESRFQPSRALLELIAQAREEGCAQWHPATSLLLGLGRGIETNVNQGASSRTYVFDNAEGHYEQTLSGDFVPKHDQYTFLNGDATRELTPNGVVGFAQFQLRHYDTLHAYDSASLFAGVEAPWRLRRWSLRTSGAVGMITLGGRPYQQQAQLQARVGPPLPLPNSTQFSVVGGFTYNRFLTLTNFDSEIADLRGQFTHRNDTMYASASLGIQRDHALARRPGGDRDGWYANLLYRRRLVERASAEVGFVHQAWTGKEAYSPGLIDAVRAQATDIGRAGFTYALGKNQSLQLEGRIVRNHENISIFQYNDRQLQLSWQWQGF
jgi:hypothetical protein